MLRQCEMEHEAVICFPWLSTTALPPGVWGFFAVRVKSTEEKAQDHMDVRPWWLHGIFFNISRDENLRVFFKAKILHGHVSSFWIAYQNNGHLGW
jgi:hypothetical protein